MSRVVNGRVYISRAFKGAQAHPQASAETAQAQAPKRRTRPKMERPEAAMASPPFRAELTKPRYAVLNKNATPKQLAVLRTNTIHDIIQQQQKPAFHAITSGESSRHHFWILQDPQQHGGDAPARPLRLQDSSLCTPSRFLARVTVASGKGSLARIPAGRAIRTRRGRVHEDARPGGASRGAKIWPALRGMYALH